MILQRDYQSMVRIECIETFLNELEKTLNEHLIKTLHSSGRILTGRKTIHDFDVNQLSDLHSVRSELNTTRNRLTKL